MKKIFIWLFLAVSILIIFIPNINAGSSSVVSEGKAMGYEYSITKEGNEYTWRLGHKGNKSVFEENEENREELYNFKQAVSDMNIQFIKIFAFTSSFLILTILTRLLHTKNKLKFKEGGAIIFLLAIIALGNTLVASTELDLSIDDARYFYYRLNELK